mmetsp:Transcript_46060/g.107650  ORF Transcript_46060/g.107650 Transcript_46060/m.107650 type:complete len:204 (-) Transcript_46060:513-1124(-)
MRTALSSLVTRKSRNVPKENSDLPRSGQTSQASSTTQTTATSASTTLSQCLQNRQPKTGIRTARSRTKMLAKTKSPTQTQVVHHCGSTSTGAGDNPISYSVTEPCTCTEAAIHSTLRHRIPVMIASKVVDARKCWSRSRLLSSSGAERCHCCECKLVLVAMMNSVSIDSWRSHACKIVSAWIAKTGLAPPWDLPRVSRYARWL